jgi:hypothetical protein
MGAHLVGGGTQVGIQDESGGRRYDPSVIIEYASGLYWMATVWIVAYSVVGLLAGLLGGRILNSGISMLIGAIAGLVIGYLLGEARARDLRLRAQLALCQVQIEANTRPDSRASKRGDVKHAASPWDQGLAGAPLTATPRPPAAEAWRMAGGGATPTAVQPDDLGAWSVAQSDNPAIPIGAIVTMGRVERLVQLTIGAGLPLGSVGAGGLSVAVREFRGQPVTMLRVDLAGEVVTLAPMDGQDAKQILDAIRAPA